MGTLEQQAMHAAVEAIAEAVVQIRTIGGLDAVDGQTLAQGPTTGLIVRADGYIVSSAFNFAQEPTSVLVRLPGGKQAPAKIVGRDSNRMLVLLKVEADDPLPVPPKADLAETRVGDWAVAVGRTYQADRTSMSVGVVSAMNRMQGRVLQTDANTSAANYGGPLVDVHGRVLGVIVPMAPESPGAGETSAVAGAEYYDSGIGFAVPLEHVLAVLDRWIEEKDLKRGLLGVSLATGNPHATPPTVTALWPKSPAADAGWKPKDRIVAVEGKQISSQTELRFQIVPRYAGDALKVTLRRGKGADAKEIESTVTLADKLAPYRHAFLGVLPQRTPREKGEEGDEEDEVKSGVVVRAVWPGSPAEAAGLKPGDTITELDGERVETIEEALDRLAAKSPDDKLTIVLNRDEEEHKLEAKLAELPIDVLASGDLPATNSEGAADNESAGEPVLEELKLPEMPQVARYYQPPDATGPFGLLLWLGDGKPETAEAMASAWQRACRRDGLILLMPAPGDEAGWSADDMEYLGRLLQTATQRFSIDPRRIVVAGEGKAGQLAYLLAFKARNVVRGVAVVDSPLPRTLELPDNSPNERLAVLSIETQNLPLSLLIRQDLRKLEKAGYPATQIVRRDEANRGALLDSSSRGKIARWIDGLDRF